MSVPLPTKTQDGASSVLHILSSSVLAGPYLKRTWVGVPLKSRRRSVFFSGMAAFDSLFSSVQLRVLTASRAQLWPNWHVDEHSLPCNKIYCIYSGHGGYSLDGHRHELGPDDLCILPTKRRSEAWHDRKDPFEKIWIHFDARILGLVDLFDVAPCPPPFHLEEKSALRALLEEMVAEAHRPQPSPYQALAQNGRLSLVLAQLLNESAGRMPRAAAAVLRGPGDRIASVLQYVAEHYAEPLSLESLADVVCLHPTYFSNTFRKATGTAPMAFLQRFRIERAKSLLASTDLPVMEVAARVGFQDPYHFSRVFKKLAGVAPKEFHQSVRRSSTA